MACNRFEFRYKIFLNLFVLLISYSSIGQSFGEGNIANKQIHKNIDSLYHTDVIGISNSGLIQGQSAMKTYLLNFQKNHGAISDAKTHFETPVYEVLKYEIGSFQTVNGSQFANLLIWSTTNDSTQKLVEIVYEQTSKDLEVPASLSRAREKWIALCGKKDAKKLVTELYTEDAIYYNRGRVLRGQDQLSKEYSYMNSPSYSLHLEPKHIEMVSDDLIYEIGMCSGSYNLPYILIWKKQANGKWKIYLDSNY